MLGFHILPPSLVLAMLVDRISEHCNFAEATGATPEQMLEHYYEEIPPVWNSVHVVGDQGESQTGSISP